MTTVLTQERGTDEAPAQLRCRVCEEHVDKLFQQDTCKDCLAGCFGKYIKMINESRGA